MDDNCGELVECMGVASGCSEQEAGVAGGSGWNLSMWLVGVLSLLLLYLFFFAAALLLFVHLKNVFHSLMIIIYIIIIAYIFIIIPYRTVRYNT